MVVRFTVIINVAVTTHVSINKKGVCLFIKGIFKPEQSVYFQIPKIFGFIHTIDKTRSYLE